MARKTKEEALHTRQLILDAAETLFKQQGISRTSLQQIAQAANVTRGAIYWHFSDKLALFQALLDRATLPVEEIIARVDQRNDIPSPLERILVLASELAGLVCENKQIRSILEILFHKMELVDQFAVMSEHHLQHLQCILALYRHLLQAAVDLGEIHISQQQIYAAAQGLQAISDGLFHNWIHAPEMLDLRATTVYNIKVYLEGLKNCRFTP